MNMCLFHKSPSDHVRYVKAKMKKVLISLCVYSYMRTAVWDPVLEDLLACLRSVSKASSHKVFGYGLLNLIGAY